MNPPRITHVSGWHLLDRELNLPHDSGRLGTIISVSFGHQTNWCLHIGCDIDSELIMVVFENPVSFRVQDEADIHLYWKARASEGVLGGTVYRLDQSPYLQEFAEGSIAALVGTFDHYLIASTDTCVEVLSKAPPVVSHAGRAS